jgi:hypothetical protein
MPTYAKLSAGLWRAQVRRRGRYVSVAFLRRDDALRRVCLAELSVDRNETPVTSRLGRWMKFSDLVRLPLQDMTRFTRVPRGQSAPLPDDRSKTLQALARGLLVTFGYRYVFERSMS